MEVRMDWSKFTPADSVFDAIREDAELHEAIIAQRVKWLVNEIALVGAAKSTYRPASASDALQVVMSGGELPVEREANRWICSFDEYVISRALNMLSVMVEGLYEEICENEYEVDPDVQKSEMARLVKMRVLLNSATPMLRLVTSVDHVEAFLRAVDECGERLVTTMPPLSELSGDTLLRRAAEADPGTWWARMIPC